MTTKIELREDLFVPWILDDYSKEEIIEMANEPVPLRDTCLNIAGLIPTQHIDNYSEIKDDLSHLVDDEDAYVEPDNRFIFEYEVVWV